MVTVMTVRQDIHITPITVSHVLIVLLVIMGMVEMELRSVQILLAVVFVLQVKQPRLH